MRRFYILMAVLSVAAGVAAQELSLDSCVALAVRNNVKTKNAQLNVEKAEQVKQQALTKYFPDISLVGMGYHAARPLFEYGINDIENASARNYLNALYAEYGRALGLENSFSLFQKGYMATATAMQPIYAGGRIVNGNKLAKLGVEAAQIQNEIAAQEVVLQTEESYWLVVSLKEKLKTIAQADELLDTLVRDADVAQSAGLVTQNDVLKVRLKKNELSSSRLKAENGLVLATMVLCQTIGVEYNDSIVLTDSIPAECRSPLDFYRSPTDALAERSEVQLLDINVEAKELERKMVMGESLPQVGFGASYGYSHLYESASNKSNGVLFATVQIPITGWWETSRKLKEHDVTIRMAENERKDLTEKMGLQTQQAWNALCESYEQVTIASEAVENAKENLRSVGSSYRAGLVPLSEMLEAQTLLRQTLDALCDERISYQLCVTRYRQLTGQ